MKNTIYKLIFLLILGIFSNQIAYLFTYFFIDRMDCLFSLGETSNESVNALIHSIESSINLATGNGCELLDSALFWVAHKSISLTLFTISFLGIISVILESISDLLFYPIKGTKIESSIKWISNLILKIPYLKSITYLALSMVVIYFSPLDNLLFKAHDLVNNISFLTDLKF